MQYRGMCVGGPLNGIIVERTTPSFESGGYAYTYRTADLFCPLRLDDPVGLELFVDPRVPDTPEGLKGALLTALH